MDCSQFTIGLTTFNRKNMLLRCVPYIHKLNPVHDYLVYDDCSTELSEEFLTTFFQNWRVFRASENSGRADFAISRLMDLFLETGKEYLVLLDSDLLIDPELSEFICDNAQNTDGFFSIFNTPAHPTISEDGIWDLKSHVGSAGTVWSRELLKEVRSNVVATNKYDWDWSDYLLNTGRRILVSKRSYVQHLGFSNGQNADNFLMGDLGINFQYYTPETLSIFLDEYLHSERNYLRSIVSFLLQTVKENNKTMQDLRNLIERKKL